MTVLLVASRNVGKVAEFRGLLGPLGVDVRSPDQCGLAEHPDEERWRVGRGSTPSALRGWMAPIIW